jgi:hypothetical protein
MTRPADTLTAWATAVFMVAVATIAVLTAASHVLDVRSEPQQLACRLSQQDYFRRALESRVTCVPSMHRGDTITVEAGASYR